MSEYFDEHAADKEIIGTLIQTNQVLWRELEASRSIIQSLRKQHNRRQPSMAHKLLQDENKILYIAKEFERITVDAAKNLYDDYKSGLSLLEGFLAKELNPQPLPPSPVDQGADQSQGQSSDQPQDQPVDQGQAQPTDQGQASAPADPNAVAGDPNATVAAPAAPADPNQVPADPNAQPAPEAAPVDQTVAPDPNQPQATDPSAQPDQPVMPPLQ